MPSTRKVALNLVVYFSMVCRNFRSHYECSTTNLNPKSQKRGEKKEKICTSTSLRQKPLNQQGNMHQNSGFITGKQVQRKKISEMGLPLSSRSLAMWCGGGYRLRLWARCYAKSNSSLHRGGTAGGAELTPADTQLLGHPKCLSELRFTDSTLGAKCGGTLTAFTG